MAQAQRVLDLQPAPAPPAASPSPTRAPAPARPRLSPRPIAVPREPRLIDLLELSLITWAAEALRFIACGLIIAGLVRILWSL